MGRWPAATTAVPSRWRWLRLLLLLLLAAVGAAAGPPGRGRGGARKGPPPTWRGRPALDAVAFECPPHAPCACPTAAANAALGRPARATAGGPGAPPGPPGAAVDGDANSMWTAHWEPAAVAEPPRWEVDLSDRYEVCQMAVAWASPNTAGYSVAASQDGVTWTMVVDPKFPYFLPAVTVHSFAHPAAFPMRWLRVTFHNDGGHRPITAAIGEVEVFGVRATSGGCPPRWVAHGLQCVRVVPGPPRSWPAAQATCREHHRGGRLATVDTAGLHAVVTQQAGGEAVWLGGSDWAAEGDWRWETGEPIASPGRWAAGEPDDLGGVSYLSRRPQTIPLAEWARLMLEEGARQGGPGEDCLLLSEGQWRDAACDAAHGFVCGFPRRGCAACGPAHSQGDPCPAVPGDCLGRGCFDAPLGRCRCDDGWDADLNCSTCTPERWGPDCQHECKACGPHAVCEADSGGCVCRDGWDPALGCAQCVSGRFGDDCQGRCPDCGAGACDSATGRCVCHAVRWDPAANCSACADGYYGDGCLGECEGCGGHGQCSITTGCVCEAGWDPAQKCTVCLPGRFGPTCAGRCPDCHGHGRCTATGNCECTAGWAAEADCGDCVTGWYGPQCEDAEEYRGRLATAVAALGAGLIDAAVQQLERCVELRGTEALPRYLLARAAVLQCRLGAAVAAARCLLAAAPAPDRLGPTDDWGCAAAWPDDGEVGGEAGPEEAASFGAVGRRTWTQAAQAIIAQAESLRRLQQAVEAAGGRHDYAAAVAWQSEVVAACRSDAGALLRRAELAVHARAYAAVRADALAAHRLRPLAPEPLYWLALGSWRAGAGEAAVAALRRCAALDPVAETCRQLRRRIAAVNASYAEGVRLQTEGHSDDAAMLLSRAVDADPDGPLAADAALRLCDLHLAAGDVLAALRRCTAAQAHFERLQQVDAAHSDTLATLHLRLSAAFLQLNDLAAAEAHWAAAAALAEAGAALPEGLAEQRRAIAAHRRRRPPKAYYRVLGVAPDASPQDIRRAYRQLAFRWHPDRWRSPKEKELATRQFQEVVEAHAVLSDPELRRLFDAGEDVLDELRRRANGPAPARPPPPDAAEVPPGLRARGEATFVVRTAQGDDFMVRMAFDGKPLAPDHCCLEWPGEW